MVYSIPLSGSLSINLGYTHASGVEPINGLPWAPKWFAHLSGSLGINF